MDHQRRTVFRHLRGHGRSLTAALAMVTAAVAVLAPDLLDSGPPPRAQAATSTGVPLYLLVDDSAAAPLLKVLSQQVPGLTLITADPLGTTFSIPSCPQAPMPADAAEQQNLLAQQPYRGRTGVTGGPLSGTCAPVAMSSWNLGSADWWWHPTVGLSWQWQLSGTPDLTINAAVYDLDLFNTTAADVAAVHAKGAKAICYLETGAWESYRPDAATYPASVLGNVLAGYPSERYVDIRQLATLRPIIDARLDQCAQKGFDGVEPDIDDAVVDVGAAAIGFPVSYADQVGFDRMVAADAHARHLAIGLKNGTYGSGSTSQFVNDLQPSVDFAVNEECAAMGVCGMLTGFVSSGKPVFHAEYLSDYPGATTANAASVLSTFCPVTTALRFSSILKDASSSLTAWRAAC